MRNAILIGILLTCCGTASLGTTFLKHVLSPRDCDKALYRDDMILNFSEGTGDSVETSIAITGHTCMSLDDVVESYLRSKFPGYKTISQEKLNDLGRMYLIVKFNHGGIEKLIYFYTSPYLVLRKNGDDGQSSMGN